MKNKAEIYRKVLYIFLLIAPFVDMLTSVGVRLGLGGMTAGMLVRFLFIAAMAAYILFDYRGKHKLALRLTVIATCLYGVIYLLVTAYINGASVLMGNAKAFLKVYAFVFMLLGLYGLYREHKILVSDKLLTIVFCTYTVSIFLSAVTNTSFPTYPNEELGYCGWFYAGNEIGAIVAILGGVALFYGAAHPKYLWVGILGLFAFSSTYIGTKVPFFANAAVTVLLLLFWLLYWLCKKSKIAPQRVVKFLLVLLGMLVLYWAGAPIRQNMELATERLPGVSNPNPTSPLYGFLNWLLSNRLYNVQDIVLRFSSAHPAEILFGIGYTFQINGVWRADPIEMDFVSILINHGVVGFAVCMAPLVCFAGLCVFKLFKQLRRFFELESAFVYLYAAVIGLGGGFLAGHVLVSPAVSLYVAICIVKCYAFLNEGNDHSSVLQA